jgi:hypothetical protein
MDENEAHQAKLRVLAAADWWAREVMRSDKSLTYVEQKLFDAVLYYQKIERASIEIPINLPRPPHLPTDLHYEPVENETPTKRYSDIPTIQSPPFGIPVVSLEVVDIDGILEQIDKLDEEPWTGKQIGKLKP